MMSSSGLTPETVRAPGDPAEGGEQYPPNLGAVYRHGARPRDMCDGGGFLFSRSSKSREETSK